VWRPTTLTPEGGIPASQGMLYDSKEAAMIEPCRSLFTRSGEEVDVQMRHPAEAQCYQVIAAIRAKRASDD
jgi:hypothetical protein